MSSSDDIDDRVTFLKITAVYGDADTRFCLRRLCSVLVVLASQIREIGWAGYPTVFRLDALA